MNDRILTIALWISLGLHAVVLILLPIPGKVEASSSVALQIEWSNPPALTSPPDPIAATPVPEETVPEETVPEEPVPEETDSDGAVSGEAVPDEAAAGSEAIDARSDDAFEFSTEESVLPPEPPPPPPAETPLTDPIVSFIPPSERTDPTRFDEETPDPEESEFEEDRIEELLRQTRERVDQQSVEKRYLLIEVRERVLQALETVHPGSSLVVEDQARYRCLLSLRIDAEGYIFDLGLRLPPGSQLKPGAIERAIGSISPLPVPPDGMKSPIELEWHVDFLE